MNTQAICFQMPTVGKNVHLFVVKCDKDVFPAIQTLMRCPVGSCKRVSLSWQNVTSIVCLIARSERTRGQSQALSDIGVPVHKDSLGKFKHTTELKKKRLCLS